MIFLNLKNYQIKDDFYFVKLGNGTIHEFKNLKKCEKFLHKTSKFLTVRFNELNLIFADIFQLYRQIYFYFDNNKNNPKAEIYEARRKINRLNTHAEDLFERLSFISDFSNANILTFSLLYSLIDSLIETTVLIKKLNENKSYAATTVRTDFLIQQLIEEKKLIQNYSIDKATAYDSGEHNLQLFNSNSVLKIVS